MTGQNGARNTQAILEEALHEMHERERKLQPFIAEIADVRKGIKTLERALDTGGGSPSRVPATRSGPPMGDEILRHLRESGDALSADQLGELLGDKRGLHMVLSSLVKSGKAIEVDGGYGLPVSVGTED